MKKVMRFRPTVEAVSVLRTGYRPGLRAVKAEYRDRFVCDDPRQLVGSIDIDTALKDALPNAPRWDYGIGVGRGQAGDRVHRVEVHPATHGDVKDVLKKLAWLKSWLQQNAQDLLNMTAPGQSFVWIATKDTGFRPGSPQARQLAAQGLGFPCRSFRIPQVVRRRQRS